MSPPSSSPSTATKAWASGWSPSRPGVSQYKVRKLTGGRTELFAAVMAEKVTSDAAERIAQAAQPAETGQGTTMPPLAVIIAAAGEVFAYPPRSWDLLELEALTRAHRDPALRVIESERIQRRWDNIRALVRRVRADGGIDDSVDDDVLAHFSLALSVGLAMVDPALEDRPRREDWDALMARIGVAVAPPELTGEPDEGPRSYWRIRVDIPDRVRGRGSTGSRRGRPEHVLAGDVLDRRP